MRERLGEIGNYYGTLAVLALMGALIGAAVGVMDTVFGMGLNMVTALRDLRPGIWIACMPLAGLVIVFCYRRFGGKAAHGMRLIFDAERGKEKEIPLRVIPMAVGATWIAHLFGASAGKEGVAMQIGAAFSHWIGRRVPVCRDRTVFLITGMAAGFGGLFGAPVTGVLFSMELFAAGRLQYQALIPACIASFTAFVVSDLLGLPMFDFAVQPLPLDLILIGKTAVLGGLFGLVGGGFARLLNTARSYVAGRIGNPYVRIFALSCVMSLCFLLFFGNRYSGAGVNLIQASFEGGTVYPYDWLLKILFTVLTVAAGFVGGEVTPLCAVGASLGAVLAPFFGLPADLAAGLGLAAVFGSGTNTFLAPIFLGVAICGYDNLPLFAIVSAVAYAVNLNQTIYPWQERAPGRALLHCFREES
ncbi:MAG: chloride channel protein [Eubacteriales bacterium]|nr:chloride channel protein [Eubacteriales bacterium]